jgi:PKD repeat protein
MTLDWLGKKHCSELEGVSPMGKVVTGKWILHSGIIGMLFLSLLVSCGGNDGATSPFAEFSTPVAEFSASPTTGNAPLTVAFSDQSTGGSVTLWFWDFGDGGTSTEQDPSHDYATAGTYTVSLTVTGPKGSDTITKVDHITVTPFAEFSASPTTGNAPLTVAFSDQSSGGIVTSWLWDFGDGGTSVIQNPSHTYNEGTYTVSLNVTGPNGSDTNTKPNLIAVGPLPPPPIADYSASQTTVPATFPVNFTDLSTGVISTWSWDFGDGGTSTAQNPAHIYLSSGVYSVSLTTTGPGGSDSLTQADYITVTPLANFSADNTAGTVPLGVQFTDLSTGGATSWLWDFGDGGTSTAQNPAHTYVTSGTYTVALTATGLGGPNTITKPNYISTSPTPPPVADFSADNTAGTAPLGVQFTDLSTGVISTWSWDFGDGGTSTEQDPSHNYATSGTYTVSLTVTGPGGDNTIAKTNYIDVAPLVVTDDFNRPNVDPIGGNWITAPNHGSVAIADNQLKGSSESPPGGGSYYNAPFGSNQYSQARIAQMANVGVTVRMSATEQSYYRFQVIDATTAQLGKYVNGIFTQIDVDVPNVPYGAGDIIRLEVSGSTLTCKRNGNVIINVTDSSLSGGYPGVRFYASVGARLDDWEGGSLP